MSEHGASNGAANATFDEVDKDVVFEQTREQLRRRLERFKRRMLRSRNGAFDGRDSTASSVVGGVRGGPPSEYGGRAPSTVSVPAIRLNNKKSSTSSTALNSTAITNHHDNFSHRKPPASIANGGGESRLPVSPAPSGSSRSDVARVQLVRALLQENEALKGQVDKWAPVISAYRSCHAMVQDLNREVKEKTSSIMQLQTSLGEIEQKLGEQADKAAEHERRLELKNIALSQLQSKVIDLKSQLESSRQAEVETKRQLAERSRMFDQMVAMSAAASGVAPIAAGIRGPAPPPPPPFHAAAMMQQTAAIQQKVKELQDELSEREQQLAATESERDGLANVCNQLQAALQATSTLTLQQASSTTSTCDACVQTVAEYFDSDDNSSSEQATKRLAVEVADVSVQFCSIDEKPIIIDFIGPTLPPQKSLTPVVVCHDAQVQTSRIVVVDATVSTVNVTFANAISQCNDLLQLQEAQQQTEPIIVETMDAQVETTNRRSFLETALLGAIDLPPTKTIEQGIETSIEMQDENVDTADILSNFCGMNFSSQTDMQSIEQGSMETLPVCIEMKDQRVDTVDLSSDMSSAVRQLFFGSIDSSTQTDYDLATASDFGGELCLQILSNAETESIVSTACSERFTNVLNNIGNGGVVEETDALRAAVRLLSREKRDLQSKLNRLAILSNGGRINNLPFQQTIGNSTPRIPSANDHSELSEYQSASLNVATSPSTPNNSLLAIQRRISELRDQLSNANKGDNQSAGTSPGRPVTPGRHRSPSAASSSSNLNEGSSLNSTTAAS